MDSINMMFRPRRSKQCLTLEMEEVHGPKMVENSCRGKKPYHMKQTNAKQPFSAKLLSQYQMQCKMQFEVFCCM